MNKELISAVSKFVVVGGISTAANYLVFFLLVKFTGTNYLVASVTGYICGLALGFFLNNFWTFNRSGYELKKIVGYSIVYLVSLAISTGFLWLSVHKFHLNKYLMNFVAIGISTVLNFLGLNSIIYKKNDSEEVRKSLG